MRIQRILNKRTLMLAVMWFAFLAVAVGCRKSEGEPGAAGVSEQAGDEELVPVLLRSGFGDTGTKGATGVTQESLVGSGFGITAYWQNYGYIFTGAASSQTLLQNVKPAYRGIIDGKPTWSFSPAVYWPGKANVSFFAYAPWMPNDSPYHQVLPNSGFSYPGGRFTQATNPSQMVDLCIANPQYDLTSAGGAVSLTFDHALTNVLIYLNVKGAVYPDEDYQYRVKSITLSGFVGENEYTYGNGDASFKWKDCPRQTLANRTASYTLSRASGHLVSTLLPHEKDLAGVEGLDRYVHVNSPASGVLYMLPQPIASTCKLSITLTACTVSGSVVTEVEDLDPIDVWLPESTVWEPGKIVAYLISLDTTTWVETLFRVSINDWGNGTSGALFYDNSVYVNKSGTTVSISKVGNGFNASDLKNNPPVLYVNGAVKGVSAWSHVGQALSAATTDGTYTFSLSSGQPTGVLLN